ncbi:RHO1 GDP-GTP exchange protein 2 [Apophysomyces sp. BC1034]|nr:RHO1 GDP-GTP exchange protein 2 [Apophysomyces sp. BC1034]
MAHIQHRTLSSDVRHPSLESKSTENNLKGRKVTASEAIRNEYYQTQQYGQLRAYSEGALHPVDEDEEDFVCRPGGVSYAPLKPPDPGSVYSLSDTGSIISLRTEYNTDDTQSISSMRTMDSFGKTRSTIFESKSGSEPKVVLDEGWAQRGSRRSRMHSGSSSGSSNGLLSRLSRTTAPMRAKLSAMSRSSNHLHSPSLSIPLVRRTAESVYNFPVTKKKIGHRSKGERSHSFSWDRPTMLEQCVNEQIVYPALLSKAAIALKDRITLRTKVKDNISYTNVFDGKEAVDKLTFLIKTTDRNIPVLLGRALDYQSFFHNVDYEHRLRDSEHEIYRFTEHAELPNGVFTPLTECYSPTCTNKNACYSVFCPRRFSQFQKTAVGSRWVKKEDRLWIMTVPKEVQEQLGNEERKRQENIFELVYTESDFVKDLTYLEELWMVPLLNDSCLDVERRAWFVRDVFWNVKDIYNINVKLAEALLKRQRENPVVYQVGDIMLGHVDNFGPFVEYGAHQIYSRHTFETEKNTNSAFYAFVESIERLPQSRKLELNGFLTKPTIRLGRYNLLLREILKHTPPDHPDQVALPQTMQIIDKYLSLVNHATGIAENKFNLKMLNEKLCDKHPGDIGTGVESSDMQIFLLDNYLLITKPKSVQNNDKYKMYRKVSSLSDLQLIQFQQPIPLALLAVAMPDQMKRSILPYSRNNSSSSLLSTSQVDIPPPSSNKNGYPISFIYLGRNGFGPITLYATTFAGRRQWITKIEDQKNALMEKQKLFDVMPISQKFFNVFNKVNCAVMSEQSIILGSDHGVYIKKEPESKELVRILALEKVSQIDILEQSNLILVLADKILYTYSLETLLSSDSNKRGRKISSHVSFFKMGRVVHRDDDKPVERTLVCFVRYNAMTSTIRALEPYASTDSKKKKKNTLGLFMRNLSEGLKVYKDLYIPGEATSIQYFKNIICVGGAKGFQMVNIASAEVQSVLDPNDENHQLILQREGLRPISMFRHPDGSILLCYNELAFYIDKKGKRLRRDWTISWEGSPTSFAFYFPYILAFDSTFIEIRHMDTGNLVQVIQGQNIRCLKPDSTSAIYCVMDDRASGNELIFELKFLKQ